MLIEFRVANYRSIGEEQNISLIPAPKQKDFPANILLDGRYNALNSLAFYGNNASGKSNIIRAIGLLDRLVHTSAKASSTDPLPYDPFELREGWESRPTVFEITFALNKERYRYGVEFNAEKVISEWMFRKGESREVPLFERNDDVIDPKTSYRGSAKLIDAAVEATRPNGLFLSTCDMLNVEEAKEIFSWFRKLVIVDGLETEKEEFSIVSLWKSEGPREDIKSYFSKLHLNILDLDVTTKPFDIAELPVSMPDDLKQSLANSMSGRSTHTIFTEHRYYDKSGKPSDKTVKWKLDEKESAGTKKAFQMSGPVVYTLAVGGILVIDEIEAKMHPIMTLHTIQLFLDKNTNPNQGQIIFATHDTNLLSYCPIRRDQIYFCEKNGWESTEIYSLSDFTYKDDKKERPDADKEKRYFEGRYGAIPMLGNFKPVKVYGKKRTTRTESHQG